MCYSAMVFLALTMAQQKLPVRNVNTGLEYATIQAAIDAEETLDGHTIQVDAGSYIENIVVNKSITLMGQSKFNTILTGQLPQPTILILVNNVKIFNLTIKESVYGYSGIHLLQTRGCNITENVIENCYYGIHLQNSINNTIQGNFISKCEYAIRLYNSTHNNITQNTITESKNGVHLDISSKNLISENKILFNYWNGIYLYNSTENIASNNILEFNEARGIQLHNSDGNNIFENRISKNQQGINLYYSMKNTIDINIISENLHGVILMNSNQNLIHANNVSFNSNYGLRLVDSSDNKIFHNNFINNTLKNVEQPTNASIGNLWDNFFEGNYWSDHTGEDSDKDGISETPYIADQRTWLGLHSEDSHPLMGQFQRLTLQLQNQLYIVEVVSNATITQLQYPDQQNGKENTLTISAIATGNASFYRISIPHTLVEPPYNIVINNNPPIDTSTVQTNGTHTWVYLENPNTEPKATIRISHQPQPPPPFWTQISFWEALGIAALAATLFLINIKYQRTINNQKRLIQLYEEKLQKAHPIVIARELFTADVESRKPKIEKFETKYGLKIQPRNTFEEILKGIKSRQKESKNQKNERET